MLLRFWGTRGSLPIALTARDVLRKTAKALHSAQGRAFASVEEAEAFAATLPFATSQTYGGHTSCVEVELHAPQAGPNAPPHEYVLCDAGSGLRPFGQAAMARHGRNPCTYHLFMSHLHWDHIMGFPFFTPAYVPGNTVRIYGCHEEVELAFRRQQAPPSFPVDFTALGASVEFVRLEPDRPYEVAGLSVRAMKQLHGGDSYGFRFEAGGRSAVYSTDSEHKLEHASETERFVAFFRDADVVVFDAMYSLADAVSMKLDWGHSSNVHGVELAQLAAVKQLVLFHHEPVHGDERLMAVGQETQSLARLTRSTRPGGAELKVLTAYDGLELPV